MNIGIVLALGSALAYGASDFVGGRGSRRHSLWPVVLVGQCAGALVMLAAGLAVPGRPVALNSIWAALAGAGSATCDVFLIHRPTHRNHPLHACRREHGARLDDPVDPTTHRRKDSHADADR